MAIAAPNGAKSEKDGERQRNQAGDRPNALDDIPRSRRRNQGVHETAARQSRPDPGGGADHGTLLGPGPVALRPGDE